MNPAASLAGAVALLDAACHSVGPDTGEVSFVDLLSARDHLARLRDQARTPLAPLAPTVHETGVVTTLARTAVHA